MSEHSYDRDIDDKPPKRRRRVGLAPLAAAAALLLVFVAVAWYALENAAGPDGQQLAAFEPPVLKAEPGPYRRKPDDPGGMQIPNQDKLVFERILPGPSPQKEERLMPKPEEPIARPEPAERPVAAETKTEPTVESAEISDDPLPVASEERQPLPPPVTLSPPAAPKAIDAPVNEPTAAAADAEADEAASPALRIADNGAPVPMEKPAELAAVAPAAAAPASAAAVDIGRSFRLQLAAFRDDAQAMKAWQRLSRKYPAELGDLQQHLVQVEISGKGVFHRLQAGPFADADAAERACQALKAKQQDCLIVKPN